MSRLNRRYLSARRASSWREAYEEAASNLSIPPASFKNLRDEFDPFFDNGRRGWVNREVRPNRQRVLLEFEAVGDAALLELVERILAADVEAIAPAIDVIESPSPRVANVAERLLTGRKAEDYFLQHAEAILALPSPQIIDRRLDAMGYDFAVAELNDVAIEVKGMRDARGQLLFTDREWSQANKLGPNYWLVVVGNLAATPNHALMRHPSLHLQASCAYQASVAVTWRAPFAI
jgi:hypothetical protein